MSTNNRAVTDDRTSHFYCSVDYHLWRFGGLAIAVYNLMYRVSSKSKKFTGSVPSIAQHFHCNRYTVDDVLHKLEKAGFIVKLQSGKKTYESNTYTVVTHNEWKKTHPGDCAEKEVFPWTGQDVDPLGQKLYFIGDSRYPLQAFQIRNFRSTGLSADVIAEEWTEFLKLNAGLHPKKWRKSAPYHFWVHLKVGARLAGVAA